MRRSSLFLVSCLLGSVLGAASRADAQTPPANPPAAQPAQPAPDPRTRLAGNYGFVGGERERAGVNAAIERATDGMNFIARPIANGRLRDRNPIYNTIGIRFPTGAIEVLFDGRSFRSPDNGSSAPGRSVSGDPVQVSHRIDGNGRIIQVIGSDGGSKRAEFVLSADGNTLTMHVTISSGSLPRPVRYSLTFRRR